MKKIGTELTEIQLQLLQNERYTTVATVDAKTGAPQLNVISWVYAPSAKQLFFAVGFKSKIIENIAKQPMVSVSFVGEGTTAGVSGTAILKREVLDTVPVKLALIQLNINQVDDIMFFGARITDELRYIKTYDLDAAAKLDRKVKAAMRRVAEEDEQSALD